MIISPSIASSNLLQIREEIDFALKYFHDVHLDIEDGVATTGITFGMKMVSQIYDAYGNIPRSIHVEYMNPLKWLDRIAYFKPDVCHIQLDVVKDEDKLNVIKAFKEKGLKTGISLSSLDLEYLDSEVYDACLKECESILFCTNAVGDPTAAFNENLFNKALEVSRKYDKELWLDGGITWEIMERLVDYPGIYAVVMGRAVYQDKEKTLRMAEKLGVLKKT